MSSNIPQAHPDYPYGKCPVCAAKGVAREKKPFGRDECDEGHVYLSSLCIFIPVPKESPKAKIQENLRRILATCEGVTKSKHDPDMVTALTHNVMAYADETHGLVNDLDINES